MLFQFLLPKFSKSERFSWLQKVDLTIAKKKKKQNKKEKKEKKKQNKPIISIILLLNQPIS